MKERILIVVLCTIAAAPFLAAGGEQPDLDYAQVLHVRAEAQGNNRWRFDVTVRHRDEGWDHYADAWQVVDPSDGSILGERILAHPHEHEQPFTRSQSNIVVPVELTSVRVRAKCNIHGFGGREVTVDLTRPKGDGYEVVHTGQ
jgi:hypothetical protein